MADIDPSPNLALATGKRYLVKGSLHEPITDQNSRRRSNLFLQITRYSSAAS